MFQVLIKLISIVSWNVCWMQQMLLSRILGCMEKSDCLQTFFKKGILKNYAIFIGKHLYWSLFLIKLQAWRRFLQNTSGGCSVKKGVLKDFANFKEEHLCWSPFLIKLNAWGPVNVLKRDSNIDIFLWNWRNF